MRRVFAYRTVIFHELSVGNDSTVAKRNEAVKDFFCSPTQWSVKQAATRSGPPDPSSSSCNAQTRKGGACGRELGPCFHTSA